MRKLLVLVLLTCCLSTNGYAAVGDSTPHYSPKVRVNWSAFLARHDMMWDRLGRDYWEAPFVGNGLIGAMFYQVSDDEMQLDIGRTDVTDHYPSPPDAQTETAVTNKGRLPIGHFTLKTQGKITGGTMRLVLYDAEALGEIRTEKGNIRWRLFTHAIEPINVMELTADEGENQYEWKWQPAQSVLQVYNIDESRINPPPQLETRQAVNVSTQTRKSGGEYAVAWQETKANHASRRLYITIADSYPKTTAADEAVASVKQAVNHDYDAFLDAHRQWWHQYYPASFISIPHTQMESFYWIQMYKFGSAIRRGGPLCDLMGPWYKPSVWPAIWWNLNTEMLYWPFYTANRLDMAQNLSDALEKNKANLIANVPREFQHDSAGISRCTGNDFLQKYDLFMERSDLIWVCHNLWLQYRYSMDEAFLKNQLYPLLRRAVNMMLHVITQDEQGKYHTPLGHSPESFNGPDTNYDLASLRWGCQTLLTICDRLKIDDELIPRWKDVLGNLVDYAMDENGYMGGPGHPAPRGHRHWIHLIMIYPYRLVNWDQPENRDLIERSWRYWCDPTNECTWPWTVMSMMASSMCQPDAEVRYQEYSLAFMDHALLSQNLRPNTMHAEECSYNRKYIMNPCSETYGGMCQMLHEMVISSWGDRIRVFPAVPKNKWPDVVIHNFRTEGGFLINAVRKGRHTQWVSIKSLAGEPCRIQPTLYDGEVKLAGPEDVTLKDLGNDVYELLNLAKGDQVVLYIGDKIPDLIIEPVPAAEEECNGYGLNPRYRKGIFWYRR